MDHSSPSPVIVSGDMQSLIDAFPCLKRKGIRWRTSERVNGNADFRAQLQGLSSGERHAASFVLFVWNHFEPIKYWHFNLADAVNSLDDENLSAIRAWLQSPWFA